ncbi:hypothetical protein Nmel_007779 [Mimus melanotis]
MPVIYGNQNPHHEQLSYEMVKELSKSVKENGLHSSFTLNRIPYYRWTGNLFFKTVLTGGKYSVWWMELVDLAQTQALNNGNQNPPLNITAPQLSGTGMYATAHPQL